MRGKFEVDMKWENGGLTNARISSGLGRKCQILTKTPLLVQDSAGNQVKTSINESGLLVFDTEKDEEHSLVAQN